MLVRGEFISVVLTSESALASSAGEIDSNLGNSKLFLFQRSCSGWLAGFVALKRMSNPQSRRSGSVAVYLLFCSRGRRRSNRKREALGAGHMTSHVFTLHDDPACSSFPPCVFPRGCLQSYLLFPQISLYRPDRRQRRIALVSFFFSRSKLTLMWRCHPLVCYPPVPVVLRY